MGERSRWRFAAFFAAACMQGLLFFHSLDNAEASAQDYPVIKMRENDFAASVRRVGADIPGTAPAKAVYRPGTRLDASTMPVGPGCPINRWIAVV
jgi:hypothetical protein